MKFLFTEKRSLFDSFAIILSIELFFRGYAFGAIAVLVTAPVISVLADNFYAGTRSKKPN